SSAMLESAACTRLFSGTQTDSALLPANTLSTPEERSNFINSLDSGSLSNLSNKGSLASPSLSRACSSQGSEQLTDSNRIQINPITGVSISCFFIIFIIKVYG